MWHSRAVRWQDAGWNYIGEDGAGEVYLSNVDQSDRAEVDESEAENVDQSDRRTLANGVAALDFFWLAGSQH